MKLTVATIALMALPFVSSAQELPTLSPLAKVEQRIGLTDVSITYSRPSMKGRRIFGQLVPLGQIWRTGANKCTVFTTSAPLTVNDQHLEAGSYSIFTIPDEGAWHVIFNRNTELWGAEERKEEEDVLKVKSVVELSIPTETFTIEFSDLSQDKANLTLRWDKYQVSLKLASDAAKQAVLNIDAALAKPDADFRAYARSASFYLERGMDPKSALRWAEKSVGMEKKYWNTFTLAKAQFANNMYKEAIATGKEALQLATAEKDNGAITTYQDKVDEWTKLYGGK